jgi:hypothetical protein
VSVRHEYPAGSGSIVLTDNTDDPSIQTVTIDFVTPPAGISLHGVEYSVNIDGAWQGNAGINLEYGPPSRYVRYESFIIPTDATTFQFNWPDTGSSGMGGAQTLEFDFIQLEKPFVWVKVGSVWQRAIPWVLHSLFPDIPGSGAWERVRPYVQDSTEWKELA